LWLWPDWTGGLWQRIVRLLLLVGGGGLAYLGAMAAMGFRLRDLRGA
jgi:putative peptidoglycan lipid II flippase